MPHGRRASAAAAQAAPPCALAPPPSTPPLLLAHRGAAWEGHCRRTGVVAPPRALRAPPRPTKWPAPSPGPLSSGLGHRRGTTAARPIPRAVPAWARGSHRQNPRTGRRSLIRSSPSPADTAGRRQPYPHRAETKRSTGACGAGAKEKSPRHWLTCATRVPFTAGHAGRRAQNRRF